MAQERPTAPPLNMDRSRVEHRDLPFLTQGRLYRVTDPDKVPVTEFRFLRISDDIAYLDGTNTPILELISTHELCGLDVTTAGAYARFFFDHVQGRHHGMKAVESTADIVFTGIATDADRDRLAGRIQPIGLVLGTPSCVVLAACIAFRDALFSAKLEIHKRGTIRVFDDALLLDNQPIVARLRPH